MVLEIRGRGSGFVVAFASACVSDSSAVDKRPAERVNLAVHSVDGVGVAVVRGFFNFELLVFVGPPLNCNSLRFCLTDTETEGISFLLVVGDSFEEVDVRRGFTVRDECCANFVSLSDSAVFGRGLSDDELVERRGD